MPVKRAARERSGGFCEAVGEWYGLPAGQRCDAPLDRGCEFDHVILDYLSKDNSLENCACVCKRCHRWKTDHRDKGLAADTKRMRDRHQGIKPTPTRAMPGSFRSGWCKPFNGKPYRRSEGPR